MKIFGYSVPETPIEEIPVLVEITLNATAAELLRMAEFFALCASEMERMGQEYDHLHLADCMKEFVNSAHLVVMRSAESDV